MTDRDYFAAAALTRGMGVLGYDQIAKSCYEMADAMPRERERTNHDAAPEAIASPSESSVPLGNGGGCGGIDKPVTLPAMGTGNLSEAEIDALEFVVEEGRIASMDDYGILRSLLVRVRPEWESQSYGESNKKRTNTNTNRVEDEIAIEAAWGRTGLKPTWPEDEAGCGVKYANAMADEIARLRLTDAEREAVQFFADIHCDDEPPHEFADTLRLLLARLA
jgi:hypothetical protein